jgi:hypothetical protein
MTMTTPTNFEPVFGALRLLLLPYADSLERKTDGPTELYLDTHHRMANGKPLFFAALRIGKRYVSYHLMPVYVDPGLLDGLSAALRARMQGKSCFNFKTLPEPALLAELAALTRAGFERYRRAGYVV